jgi:iron complex transport system ATP-binding protein
MLNELSGGLQQRVFLSMQLAQNSPYMVMDEPMNFLDFASKRDIYRLIRDLAKKGKTVVIVMHDIGQALKLADEIVVMKDRKVVACNSPKACIDSGVIEEVFDCKIKSVEVDGETEYLVI